MTIMAEAAPTTPLCHIVTPSGMLGYGLNLGDTEAALDACMQSGEPTALILDSGSTDSGPSKLALGGMTMPREAYVRDLRKLVTLACRYSIPLMFSSAGGSGTDDSVHEMVKVVREIVEGDISRCNILKIVAIFSDIDKSIVRERLAGGEVVGCGRYVPPLTEEDIDACPVIASQMGPEPFIRALDEHGDLTVLAAGRAYDPAPFVAFAEHCYRRHKSPSKSPTDEVVRLGGFTHMGKIMECGGVCATPKSLGARATVYTDGSFDVEPLSGTSVCTPLTVAAHTLYEKSRPDLLHGPGGILDLTQAAYEQCDDQRTVKVRGARFWSSRSQGLAYQVKLEGAKPVGYRAMYIGVHRDPLLIGQMDNYKQRMLTHVTEQLQGVQQHWTLDWHLFGKASDGAVPDEACIVGEALATTQELANSVIANAKIANIHGSYPGQKATSGNMGFGIGGLSTIPLGPSAQFCVYHLMALREDEEGLDGASSLFRTEVAVIDALKVNCNGHPPQRTSRTVSNGHAAAVRKQAPVIAMLDVLPDVPTIGDIARVVRSKNSGPFDITMDIVFEQEEVFRAVRTDGILQDAKVAALLGVQPEQIIWAGFFDQARAYKVTIPRLRDGKPVAAGGYMEDDVHGSQMYRPLLDMKLTESLVKALHGIVCKNNLE